MDLRKGVCSLTLDSSSKSLGVLYLLTLELLYGPLWSLEGLEWMEAGQLHCNVYYANNNYVLPQLPPRVKCRVTERLNIQHKEIHQTIYTTFIDLYI